MLYLMFNIPLAMIGNNYTATIFFNGKLPDEKQDSFSNKPQVLRLIGTAIK